MVKRGFWRLNWNTFRHYTYISFMSSRESLEFGITEHILATHSHYFHTKRELFKFKSLNDHTSNSRDCPTRCENYPSDSISNRSIWADEKLTSYLSYNIGHNDDPRPRLLFPAYREFNSDSPVNYPMYFDDIYQDTGEHQCKTTVQFWAKTSTREEYCSCRHSTHINWNRKCLSSEIQV